MSYFSLKLNWSSNNPQWWRNNHKPPRTVWQLPTLTLTTRSWGRQWQDDNDKTPTTKRTTLAELPCHSPPWLQKWQKGWGEGMERAYQYVQSLFFFFVPSLTVMAQMAMRDSLLPLNYRLRALITTRGGHPPFGCVFLHSHNEGSSSSPLGAFPCIWPNEGRTTSPLFFLHSSQWEEAILPFFCTGHNEGRSSSPLTIFSRTQHNNAPSIIIICIKLVIIDNFFPRSRGLSRLLGLGL